MQGAFAHFTPSSAAGARHAAMILDANTGAVLHNEDGDEPRHPASLTKMMTLYLTFETLQSGRMSMSDKIMVSQEAASQAPSKLDLEPGEEISVSDAVRALVTKSANDVAVALAEKIGGSERNFVRLMNTRAREIGMMRTHFENASGLPNNEQVTTARDMITLGLRLQDDFPAYYPLFATRAFSYNGATLKNHNTMLNSFQGIDGIKTGYTRASGFNLVSSVHRGGRHVVGAVFGGASAATRNGEMRMLLTRALTRASTFKSRKPAPQLIAQLKSAPRLAERPKLKDKPKIQIAAVPPMPKPFAPAKVSSVAEAEPVPQAPPAQPSAAPIDIFKVKRVMVAPRQGPKRPPPSADETTDQPDETAATFIVNSSPQPLPVAPFKVASTEPAEPVDALAQALAATDGPPSETMVPKLPTVASSEPERGAEPLGQMAMLGARDGRPASLTTAVPAPVVEPVAFASIAPAARPAPVAAAVAAQVERGRAPSSLQAQAAQMPPAGPQRMAAVAPASAASSRYEIQIGAYSSIGEAQNALTSTQARAGKLLAGYASVTHPVQKAGRQVFRARFSGFEAQRAASTCTELRRQSIDCFVMTAE